MYNIQQNTIQIYQPSQNSKFSNHSEQNIQNQSQSISKIENHENEDKLKFKNQEQFILKQLNQNNEEYSRTINKNKKLNQKYEKVQLFDSKFTKVTIQFNEKIKRLTIKKYFKSINKQEFENEIEILQNLANHQITLPLVQYSKNNELWYEQIAGQKDFCRNFYYYQNQSYKQHDYLDNLKIIFSKLYLKLDKMFKLGYAHSDIKPQNIVLGYDNEPYFIDFGASVKLNDFKNYLNQFTPLYNHSRYLQIKEKNVYETYNFSNEEEVKQCDRIQLTLTLLNLIIKTYEFSQNNQIKIINDNIILLNEYFKKKEFEKILQLLFNIDKNQIFYETKQQQKQNTNLSVNSYDDHFFIDDDLMDILNIINERDDHYSKIKDKIYKFSTFNLNNDIFSDFQGNVLKRINQYNANLINLYLDQKINIEINLNFQSDLNCSKYPLQHGIIYNLQILQQSFNKIFLKKQSNQIIYNIPFLQFPYYHSQGQYYINKNTEQIQFIQNLKLSFNQDNSQINREKIGEQFRNKISLFSDYNCEDFLKENNIILENYLFEHFISYVKNYFQIANDCFKKNIIIVKMYEIDFINDELFNQIHSYSNERNKFEIEFINCRFNKNLCIKINQFLKRYKQYDILYSNKDYSERKQSSVCCLASTDHKIDENQEQIQQKKCIKLQFINTKQDLHQNFQEQIVIQNLSSIYYQSEKVVFSILQESQLYSVLDFIETFTFKELLDVYFINNKNKDFRFFYNYEEQQIAFIINENIFLNYFFSEYQEDSITLMLYDIDNFIFINIDGIQYMISHSICKNIAQFLKINNFNSEMIDKTVLIISILGQKKEYQIDEYNFEQQNNNNIKMSKIKNTLLKMFIDDAQYKNYIEDRFILETIQTRYKKIKGLQEVIENNDKKYQYYKYEQYPTQEFKDYQHFQYELFNKIQDQYTQFKQKEQTKQKLDYQSNESKMNPQEFKRVFEFDFEDELKQLSDSIKKKLRCDEDQFINGEVMYQLLKYLEHQNQINQDNQFY